MVRAGAVGLPHRRLRRARTAAICSIQVVDAADRPLLVYDGECRFCTATALRVAARWPPSATATVVAWQSLGEAGLAGLGLSVRDVESAAYWVDENDRKWRGHCALAQALVAAAGWRRQVGRAILVLPLRPAAAGVYWIVARYRRYLPVPGLPAVRKPHN
jgi:predicted DCC family thiol-disulfide oxidoreductase YuxK